MKMDLEGFDLVEFARRHQTWIISFISVGVGLVVLRKWCSGGVCRSKAKLHGKTAIITGANVGIGKETARDLAGRGAKVIMACRDLQKAENAAAEIIAATRSDKVVVRKLDLASMTSIRKFANEILDTEKEVNLLINNAGIMMCPEWKTEDGFEMQFGVNHLGHFLLTNLLLDKIKKSAPARIVNVSSNAHERGKMDFDDLHSRKSYSFSQAYANSKLANVLFSRELSKRLTGTNVTVNSLHPGVINTELTRHLSTTLGVVLYTVLTPVRILFKTPWQGAQTTIYCAVSEEVADVTGKYFADCGITKESKAAQSDEDAKRLWEISEEMVGLKSR